MYETNFHNKLKNSVWELLKRFFAYSLCVILILQQMLSLSYAGVSGVTSELETSAGSLRVDGNSNTSLDRAQNNVPLVKIAAPSANGVSRNSFESYNVGSEGLILNNSKTVGVSQLGGVIYGNPNFTANIGGK